MADLDIIYSMLYTIAEAIEMRPPKAHKLPAVALLQLGSEVHSALESAARQSGHSKSEFVRLALQGAIKAQDGYWERLLMELILTRKPHN